MNESDGEIDDEFIDSEPVSVMGQPIFKVEIKASGAASKEATPADIPVVSLVEAAGEKHEG